MFEIANLGDLDKPLNSRILSNPYHPITKKILYIYSMESFVYSDLNKACRSKDETKIKSFGAYGAALSYIIYFANKRRQDKLIGKTLLYRGLKLTDEELEVF